MHNHLSDALRSALEASADPAQAAADWLARDIDPAQPSAVALLTDPDASLEQLQKAKSAYKTMRILGETPADRRLAARLYAAAIAAGLVRHKRRISRQSDDALRRGLQSLLNDARMPDRLRDLAGMALCALSEKGSLVPEPAGPGSSLLPRTSERRRQSPDNGRAPDFRPARPLPDDAG
ncbi:MAG: hypothetical protein ACYS0G_02840 [Planctomycetota bacterium]